MPEQSISESVSQYANLWLRKENAFVSALASSDRGRQLAALNAAAGYFKIARNFKLKEDVGRGLERLGPMLDILDRHRTPLTSSADVYSAVTIVRREAATAYGKSDLLSAATKFLWLLHRHRVVIFDGNVRTALNAPAGDYGFYTQLWEAKYSELGPLIRKATDRVKDHRVPSSEEWFRRRVLDIHLWNAGDE